MRPLVGRRRARDSGSVNDPDAVRALHWSTLLGERPAHPERLVPFRRLDPANRPAPFKRYPGLSATPLPRGLARSTLAATEVLSGRRAEATSLTGERLATLLFLTAGVTRYTVTDDGERVFFRTAMSAGNLHPIEVYVVTDASLGHYEPLEHALTALRGAPEPAEGAATLVLTGIPFRTCWKYGERGWRHLWWDAGTMVANLLSAADGLGVPARVVTGFPDAQVAELVGVDGLDEAPLVLVSLGHAGPADGGLPDPAGIGPLQGRAAPVAPRPLRLPMVLAAHEATSLDAASVTPWLAAVRSVAAPAPEAVDPPPWPDAGLLPAGPSPAGPSPAGGSTPGPGPADRVEEVIRRRGSSRLFDPSAVPETLLLWGLGAATRAVPGDLTSGRTLLEHLVNVHGLEGVSPGPYRYTPAGGYESVPGPADPRGAATRLCLDQPLGGDAAFTTFQAAKLDRLLETGGARAYRAAHLEAGIVAGRLSLNASALGFGATGLTFYDTLVARYFDTVALPLLATAVGRPGTSPAPSGLPGQPAALTRYGNVAARLWARLQRDGR